MSRPYLKPTSNNPGTHSISRIKTIRHARRHRWLWRGWSRRNLGKPSLTPPTWAAPLDYSPVTQLLNEHSEHEVHLYEADDRPGGHANTVHVAQPGKEPVDVDTYADISVT